MKRSRRQVLKGIGAVIGAASTGCGRSEEAAKIAGPTATPTATITATPTPTPNPTPSPIPTPLSPSELLANIDTIVVLMMENRSFDHFLGSRKFAEGLAVDGLTGTESNLDPAGNPVAAFMLEDFTPEDPPHGWDAAHAQWNEGANDGFVTQHAGPSQNDVMGYHLRSQIPALYSIADEFVVCDRWFASCLGPTWPNRYHLHGATSAGVKSNLPVLGFTSIHNRLKDEGIPFKTYFHDLPFQAGYGNFDGVVGIEQFFQDASTGALPSFSIIDPKFTGADGNDDHPDHDIQLGQALIASVYAALSQSPQWSRCLFVLTYDENGGFYDHVAPPKTVADHPGFEQLGFRVPALVAGPMVKKGVVVSTPFEHVSVISTLTQRHNLLPLNVRAELTADLSSCIDPALLNAPRPAPPIPKVQVSLSKLRARMARPVPRSHPELQDLADRGEIPRAYDRRAQSGDITRRLLEAGSRLGALRLID